MENRSLNQRIKKANWIYDLISLSQSTFGLDIIQQMLQQTVQQLTTADARDMFSASSLIQPIIAFNIHILIKYLTNYAIRMKIMN